MAEKARAGGLKWWTTWAHDDGAVHQAAERPEPAERDDGRPGLTFGPYDTKEAAEERLKSQHSRCLKSLASGKVG